MTEPRAAGSAAISDALRASMLDRIKRLERRDRAVLMCAAVIGLRFDVAVLAASCAYEPVRVESALERACELQLLERDGTGACFTFRHALTRDVIYAELLAERTRPLHRRIARALENDTARRDGALEEIAFHWWAAGDAQRGRRSNELAGDRAASMFAARVALVHYHRALGLADAASPDYARLTEKVRSMQVLDAAGAPE